jgi:acetyltransferase-like isoleucine patch superfamily enzyme
MIHPIHDIRGMQNIEVHPEAVIQYDTWIDCTESGHIKICKEANIGRRAVIGCGNYVEIGEKALIGPNVYINDHQHEYRDVLTPIVDQGLTCPRTIKIGPGAWVGMNSVVMANVGTQSVIGANSVVTRDIPDYCVAVGAPARVIKTYDFKKMCWKKKRRSIWQVLGLCA